MILFRNSWTDPRLLRVRAPGRGLWLPPGEGAAASGDLGPLCPPGKALPSNLKEPASSQCSLARRGPGRRLNAPGPALADPPRVTLQPGPKLPLLRSPAGHSSQLRLENPSWRLPIPELRQNHVNSDLMSGWVAVRNARQPEDEGGGTAPSRHPGPAFPRTPDLAGNAKA